MYMLAVNMRGMVPGARGNTDFFIGHTHSVIDQYGLFDELDSTVFRDTGISFRFVCEAAGTTVAGDEGDGEVDDILGSSGGGGDGGYGGRGNDRNSGDRGGGVMRQ
jgi:hypothetical protein